jgi:hypothetical protein
MTVSRELWKYKLDLVGVQEDGGTEPAEEYTFFMELGTRTMNQVQAFLCIRKS